MPTLGKTWQLLLKGLGEVNIAPSPQTAAEMVIIRLVYAADLPDPADLIKKLKDQPASNQGASLSSSSYAPPRETAPVARGSAAVAPAPAPHTETITERAVHSLEDIVALLQEGNAYLLAGQVAQFVHLVRLEQGKLEINLEPEAPPRLAQDIAQNLSALSGRRWMVSVSGAKGALTLAQQEKARQQKEFEDVLKLPEIRDILEVFPDAKITGVKNKG